MYNQGKSAGDARERVARPNQLSVASKQPRADPARQRRRARSLPYHGRHDATLPWWLRRRPIGDMFDQSSAEMVTGEDRVQDSGVEVRAAHRRRRRAGAHRARSSIALPTGRAAKCAARSSTVPEISVLLEHEVEYARANAPFDRTMLVFVHSAATAPRDVDVSLALPAGLHGRHRDAARHAPAVRRRERVLPRAGPAAGRAASRSPRRATSHGERFAARLRADRVRAHSSAAVLSRSPTVQIEAVNATFANLRIGYIRGVGDNVMPMLEELGLPVDRARPGDAAAGEAVGLHDDRHRQPRVRGERRRAAGEHAAC